MITTPQLIDISLLEEVSAGDNSFKKMMIEMIHAELTTEVPKMVEMLEKGDWSTIHNISHKLKTTLGYICGEDICAPNRQVESASKHQTELDIATKNIENLNHHLPLMLEELENLAASM